MLGLTSMINSGFAGSRSATSLSKIQQAAVGAKGTILKKLEIAVRFLERLMAETILGTSNE